MIRRSTLLLAIAACGRSAPATEARTIGQPGVAPPAVIDAPRQPTTQETDDGEGSPPNAGLEHCDQSAPLPAVQFEDYYPSKRACDLSGDYEPANFCVVARALASQGIAWTTPVILTPEQSQTLIKDVKGLDRGAGRLIVNPRASGEVSTRTRYDQKYYCVTITAERIEIVLWKHFAS